MNPIQSPVLVTSPTGETVEVTNEAMALINEAGPYTWCMILSAYPQLAPLCMKWREMVVCGKAWESLLSKHPEFYAYVIVSV